MSNDGKPQSLAASSIQGRLLKGLLLGLPALWLLIIALMGLSLRHEINEINDTQITQVARYLVGIGDGKTHLGEAEDDYMGFAIWEADGTLIMADENGVDFEFLPKHKSFEYGFVDAHQPIYQRLNPFNRQWRLFFVKDRHNGHVIAVGQNLSARQEMIFKTLGVQLLPMLMGLVLLIAWTIWQVRRGLTPLHSIRDELSLRTPKDDKPLTLPAHAIPREVAPLVSTLNEHFVQTAQALKRESQFTADASHELKSPLTALRLHADLLEQRLEAMSIDPNFANLVNTNDLVNKDSPTPSDELTALYQHSQQIRLGIDRMQHLTEQLLILAKLDPTQALPKEEMTDIDWLALSEQVLAQVNLEARQKHIRLKRTVTTDAQTDEQADAKNDAQTTAQIMPLTGNATLLALLLRNLLDNAIRYCPTGSTVTLTLASDFVRVSDDGHGVASEALARLSERFYRPAGQHERGSGLGLSIVKRIAELHGLAVQMNNRYETDTDPDTHTKTQTNTDAQTDTGQVVGFAVTLLPV